VTEDSSTAAGRSPYWHDDIGKSFFELMQHCDAFLLGRRTYVAHAEAFEPLPAGDPFGDVMNSRKKYVVSRTLQQPMWRNTTIIRDDVIGSVLVYPTRSGAASAFSRTACTLPSS
jgi:dihydrofolate reductase